MRATVLQVDLAVYKDGADTVDKVLGAEGVRHLDNNIQKFIDDALKKIGIRKPNTVVFMRPGDAAGIHFKKDGAQKAYRFAVQLHLATDRHNRKVPEAEPMRKRFFRIGVATGDVDFKENTPSRSRVAGSVLGRAARLETKAPLGGLLLDRPTYEQLPEKLKKLLRGPKKIPGKPNEAPTAAWEAHVIPTKVVTDWRKAYAKHSAAPKRTEASSPTINPFPENDDLLLSAADFLREFKRRSASHHEFCWVLGSGISRTSHVPMGRELADRWLGEAYLERDQKKDGHLGLREWANATFKQQVPEFEFERRTNYYWQIYHYRFRNDPALGYKAREDILDRAKMSFGYPNLAQIMTTTRHRIAITTHIDNLLAEAITFYTNHRPFVCEYESLTYLDPDRERPLIAKLQRDLLFKPGAEATDASKLPDEWRRALVDTFKRHTPVVIGYGDEGASGGSLMSFLAELDELPQRRDECGMYWCFVGKPPAPDVQMLVRRLKGRLVPILGFDELMLQFSQAIAFRSPEEELTQKVRNVLAHYHEAKARTMSSFETPGADRFQPGLTPAFSTW